MSTQFNLSSSESSTRHSQPFLVRLGTGLAIGVVLQSSGQPEADWSGHRQPGVLLAYTSTLANALTGLAFAQAAVVFFWTQAVQPMPVKYLLSFLHQTHTYLANTVARSATCTIIGQALRAS